MIATDDCLLKGCVEVVKITLILTLQNHTKSLAGICHGVFSKQDNSIIGTILEYSRHYTRVFLPIILEYYSVNT